jgi:uncharacterized protein (DUF1697 family)
MSTHVAFLRGINVGGHTVTNARLAELFEQLGMTDVTTFQASGNVLFAPDDDGGDERTLEERIGAHLADGLGYAVATFVRSADHLRATAEADPFPDAPTGGKVHVGFLRAPLSADEQRQVAAFALDTDRVAFDGRETWWHLGTGRMMDSGLGDPALARLLGDRWTVRTHATIQRIARKLDA